MSLRTQCKKNRFYIIIICLFTSILTCSKEMPMAIHGGLSNIDLKITVEDPNSQRIKHDGSLGKPTEVTGVTVTITGPGMSTITKTLTKSGETYTGSVEVPKGDSRQFTVEASDESGIVQYEGSKTQAIRSDAETVSITLSVIAPTAVVLSIASYTSTSVTLSWTLNSDNDFHYYRVCRSQRSSIDLNSDKIENLYSIYTQSYTDTEVEPDTKYYYRIYVVDTEAWASGSNTESVTTEAASIETELYYDDGSFEDYLNVSMPYGGFVVTFSCPSYPCYLQSIKLYLIDESGEDGNYRNWVFTPNYSIFESATPRSTSDPGWVTWTFGWTNYEDGLVYEDFFAGFKYEKDNGYPGIGLDMDSGNKEHSYMVLPDTEPLPLEAIGFPPANLGIRVIVETTSGQSLTLYPNGGWKENVESGEDPDVKTRGDGPASLDVNK